MLNETKKKSKPTTAHENYMGGISYDLSPFATLYVMSASAFFGEAGYYEEVRNDDREYSEITVEKILEHLTNMFGSFGETANLLNKEKNRAKSMVQAIEKALDYDAELTMRFLVWLRNKALIRSTPAVGLAVAAHHKDLKGSGIVTSVSNDIFSRLDDVTNCLAFYLKEYGKPIPNSLKKAIAKRLTGANPYELAKYSGKSKNVSLKDAIYLTHAYSESIDKFCKGEIKQNTDGIETWEAIISSEGSNKATWMKAVDVMGHMALLRNLRNLEKHEVDKDLYLTKLINGTRSGKQLPFRYWSAYRNTTDADIKEALEECIDISLENLPTLKGRTLILVDNSGSARHQPIARKATVNVCDAGNMLGVLAGMMSESGRIGVFGDRIAYVPVNKNYRGTCMELLRTVDATGKTVGQSTENGIWLALRDAIESKESFDRIIIISDMQAGHGGLYGLDEEKYPVFPGSRTYTKYIDVPQLVRNYRKAVNPDCKLYSIQIGGYSDNIAPEFFPNSCILSGWSTETLKFISMFENDPMNIEEYFRNEFNLPKR